MPTRSKPLYLLRDDATLRLDGPSLRVLQTGKADARIPVKLIDRAIVQPHENDLLQACLAIVRQGGTVHFTDGAGHIRGMLQQPSADGTSWARELARFVETCEDDRPYRIWRDNQQRHAWSLVFRRGYCGDFEANRRRLLGYLAYFRPELNTREERQWLEEQLLAWVHAQLATEGLYPLVRALHTRGAHLVAALQPCLFIPLLWAFVRWRRRHPWALVADKTAFFELQAAAPMRRQFRRHIRALAFQYHTACGIEARGTDTEPGP